MATDTAPATAGASNHLRRNVGMIGLLWASETSIIGSGWLKGAERALVTAGPAAIIAWGIGSVAIIILALVHAELGGMFPVAGGSARFAHYAFGGAAGASFGWFAWLQAASVAPIEVEATLSYTGHYSFAANWTTSTGTLHGWGYLVAVIAMAIFVAVNFIGIRALAQVSNAITWWKIAVPLATILIVAVTHFHASNFSAGEGFMPHGIEGVFGAVSGSGIIFSLLGFEQAIQLGGESSNPKKDIPRATIYSILIGAAVYILLQVFFIGAIPAANIPHMWSDLNFPGISGPWAGLTTLVGLGWLAKVLFFDAVVSPFGTGVIYTTATSRYSIAMEKNGYWPRGTGKLNGAGIPWVGLLLSFIIGCACFINYSNWNNFVGFITSASVLMYAGAPLAFGVFRTKLPDWERPFRLFGGVWMAPLAFVVANLVIFWSGWSTLEGLGIAIVLGYLVIVVTQVFRLNSNPLILDLRAASWLPIYLLGMGAICWASDFGPGHSFLFKTAPLHYWWSDILAVTVFSLAIYYWAQAVALPVDKLRSAIETTSVAELPAH
ncbi:APC family permease [Actinospica durhamensis]|uniref:APC family permease n=1 Tax=Actinospica durhamensis TaxID=1508375 RepID=A0A941EW74_9ACTN|nr:APC family permease [Actinospica durhamensis]MBR7838396.1 APC family permease [Actinospica durhamensis]